MAAERAETASSLVQASAKRNMPTLVAGPPPVAQEKPAYSIATASRDYLEGDERVYVDGAASPSAYGTGVEDFFNGGFFFDRGLVSAPLFGSAYTLATPEGETVDGMYRLLLGDAVPFQGGIRVALENGPGPPTGHLRMRARAIAYGYSRDDRTWQLVDRLDLHRRLVGLDLGDDVAGFDLVAFLLQPLGKVALLHRGRQRRHEDVDRHGVSASFLPLSSRISLRVYWGPSQDLRSSRRRTP